MTGFRLSIRTLMAAVVLVAVGTASLRSASELWASLVLTLTLGVLATAIPGALFGGRPRRPFWTGVAVFGWGYPALAFGPWSSGHSRSGLATTALLDHLFHRANPDLGRIVAVHGAIPFYLV